MRGPPGSGPPVGPQRKYSNPQERGLPQDRDHQQQMRPIGEQGMNNQPPVSSGQAQGPQRKDSNPQLHGSSPQDRERASSRSRTNRKGSGQIRRCNKCGEPLQGQFVRALGGTYHLDCFKCKVSTRSFHVPNEYLANEKPRRTVERSLHQSSSRLMTRTAKANILFVKLTTLVVSASYVTSVIRRFVVLTLPPSTRSTTWTTSRALCVQPYLGRKTATTSMKGRSTAITITRHSSLNAVSDVKRQSSSSLSRFTVMVRISTGTQNAI